MIRQGASRPRPSLTFALAVLFAAACGSDSADRGDGDGETLRVDPVPVLEIGVLEGAPEEQFQSVVQVGLLGDSVVAVVDTGARAVRFFDRDGRFLSESGGRGEGPGELAYPTSAWVTTSGEMGVLDGVQGRLTLYRPDGGFDVNPLPLRGEETGFLTVAFRGRVGDRWFALTDDFVPFPPGGETMQLTTTTRVLVRDEFPEALAVPLPSVWFYTTRAGRSVRLPLALGPFPRLHVNRDVAAALDAQNGRLFVMAEEDETWRVVELDVDCLRPPDELLAPGEVGEELRAGIPLAELRSIVPGCLPSYDHLTVTGDGRIWIRRTRSDRMLRATGEEASSAGPLPDDEWLVLDSGDLTPRPAFLPADFVPLDADGSLLVGQWRDDFDVQYVRGYRVAGR